MMDKLQPLMDLIPYESSWDSVSELAKLPTIMNISKSDNSEYSSRPLVDSDISSEFGYNALAPNGGFRQYNLETTLDSYNEYSVPIADLEILNVPMRKNATVRQSMSGHSESLVRPLVAWDISSEFAATQTPVGQCNLESMLDTYSECSVRPLADLEILSELYNVPVPKNVSIRQSMLKYSRRPLADSEISCEFDFNTTVSGKFAVSMYNDTPMMANNEFLAQPLADLEISGELYNVPEPKNLAIRQSMLEYSRRPLADSEISCEFNTTVSEKCAVSMYSDTPMMANNEFLAQPRADLEISGELYNVPEPKNLAIRQSMLEYSRRPLADSEISCEFNTTVSEKCAVSMYSETPMMANNEFLAQPRADLEISGELYNVPVPKNVAIRQPMLDKNGYSYRPLADSEISCELNTTVSEKFAVSMYNEAPMIVNNEFLEQPVQNLENGNAFDNYTLISRSNVVELLDGPPIHNKNFSPVDRTIFGSTADTTSITESIEGNLGSTIDDYLLTGTTNQTIGKKKRKPKQKKADKIKLAADKKRTKHTVKEPCSCKKNCREKITDDRRTEINVKFWDCDYIAQKLYIRAQSTVSTPKTTKHPSSARDAVKYFLRTENGENGRNVEICQNFFLGTLGFKPNNNTFLRNALDKEFPDPDGRGKHMNKHKFDESVVIDHIMSFHPETSHYRREHAPFRKYLPSDVTITKMHKLFLDQHPSKPCSYDYYRKVVDKLNISFTKLGHEKCEKCEKYHKHFHIFQNENSGCQDCIGYEEHKKFYHEARIHYEADKLISDDPRNVKVSADKEKVVMVPRMEQFKEVLFTKRICVFNETFAPIGGSLNLPVFASLWHEGIAGSKKEDLISCYRSFLLYYRNAITITIWCDNCTSQNKCWALFCFMVYIVNSNEIAAESISMKFLEKGHTFMSADSFHHQVELAMKHYENGNVCDFDDFVKCVQSANSGRVVAKELSVSDFADWPDWTSTSKLNNATPRPYINNMSKLKFVRGKKTMLYANSFEDDWIELDFIMAKHQSLIPPEMRTAPRGISREVKEGIIRKLVSMMPFNRRLFWYGIPTNDYTH